MQYHLLHANAALHSCGPVHTHMPMNAGIMYPLSLYAHLHLAHKIISCKVLDIPRTLEYLETQGVCVAAYGTDEFPAFFTPHSGCKAPCRVDFPEQ